MNIELRMILLRTGQGWTKGVEGNRTSRCGDQKKKIDGRELEFWSGGHPTGEGASLNRRRTQLNGGDEVGQWELRSGLLDRRIRSRSSPCVRPHESGHVPPLPRGEVGRRPPLPWTATKEPHWATWHLQILRAWEWREGEWLLATVASPDPPSPCSVREKLRERWRTRDCALVNAWSWNCCRHIWCGVRGEWTVVHSLRDGYDVGQGTGTYPRPRPI
jgi:hypothetical protein